MIEQSRSTKMKYSIIYLIAIHNNLHSFGSFGSFGQLKWKKYLGTFQQLQSINI